MGISLPTLNAYLAANTEAAALVLLPLDLGNRFISIPLMITIAVAILTVHFGNGFDAGDNGSEIPIYYMLMLFAFLLNSAGKYCVDQPISRKIVS